MVFLGCYQICLSGRQESALQRFLCDHVASSASLEKQRKQRNEVHTAIVFLGCYQRCLSGRQESALQRFLCNHVASCSSLEKQRKRNEVHTAIVFLGCYLRCLSIHGRSTYPFQATLFLFSWAHNSVQINSEKRI